MLTLEGLNTAPANAFAVALSGVFEHAPWVAANVADLRPFATLGQLHGALMAVLAGAPDDVRLRFLGGYAGQDLGLPADLADPMAEYHRSFGIPFIICARRHTAADALRRLRDRLAGTRAAEEAAAFAEIGHIARLRLADQVAGPDTLVRAGTLSTQVLDTRTGQPAEGMAVALLQEGCPIAQGVTGEDGTPAPLLTASPLRIGRYELSYEAGAYFGGQGVASCYGVIPVRFLLQDTARCHVQLLLAPFSYGVYQGG